MDSLTLSVYDITAIVFGFIVLGFSAGSSPHILSGISIVPHYVASRLVSDLRSLFQNGMDSILDVMQSFLCFI